MQNIVFFNRAIFLKRILWALLLATGWLGMLLTSPTHAQNKAVVDDKIVAIVNNEIITLSELDRQTQLISQQMQRRGAKPPDSDTLRRQVLERMINDRAQLQVANEQGLRVDDAQVEAAMARVAEQSNMRLNDFIKNLQKEGVSLARFRDEVRSEMILARLREREVENKIQVTETEIATYLNARRQGGPELNRPEVNWIQLLVRTGNSNTSANTNANKTAANPTDAERKARALERQLASGASIADLIKTNPELAIEGTGNMGWQSFDAVPSLFSDFLSRASVNAVSTVQSPNGFHVLKIVGRRDSSLSLDNTPVIQTRVRHILIRTGPDLPEAEARRRLTFALEQLRAGQASFENLAKRYSQDGSAAKGGDLGWLYPGDTVPEFEREMNALRDGGVSPVFESRFGFHIVQAVERRQQAASEERQRQVARQAIRNSKSEEAYLEWLRQLRDRTFVDLRL